MRRNFKLKMEFYLLIPLISILLIFWFMALISKEGRAIGLVEGRLARCIEKPNCVCTEYSDDKEHFYHPIAIPDGFENPEEMVQLIKGIIREAGGEVEIESHTYISAIFQSRVFGFVDDFEVRIDLQSKSINIRSASRIGYSDFGANLKRIKRIDELLQKRFSVMM